MRVPVLFLGRLKRVIFQLQESSPDCRLSGGMFNHKDADAYIDAKHVDSLKSNFLRKEMSTVAGAEIQSGKNIKESDWLCNGHYSPFQHSFYGKNSSSHLKNYAILESATKLGVKKVLSHSFCSSSVKDKLRAPLWRGKKVISLEAQRATTALKGAKDRPRHVNAVLQNKVARLLKLDMLSVLYLLQQQNETDLALKVFNLVRKETWYKPEMPFYRDMMEALGKNGQFEEVEKLFQELKSEGLKLQMIVFIEIIQNCFLWRKFSLALDYLERMKHSDCPPNVQVYRTFINSLNKMGELDLSAQLEKDCEGLN
ncbi:hypothetical protein O6H91_04G037000 [Diphasiastrum complanatum]|uniref:Uncharacterized protein n=1 Tax=Diphasiastrum complanatum TaxID=34168 RepID=A0ACC2DVV0_DIPCM|nr:hypothetical protein O6H91_04G037000 [Diphasiastrum complanatum]